MGGEVFWLMVAGIAQVVLAIGLPATIWVGMRAERDARMRQREDERDKFYAQLDDIYLDIQKILLDHPNLADQDRARTGEEKVRYEVFAFIVWNFIESIHDYCLNDEILGKTWHCILEAESRSHSNWFNEHRNRSRFKQAFVEYIDRNGYTSLEQAA